MNKLYKKIPINQAKNTEIYKKLETFYTKDSQLGINGLESVLHQLTPKQLIILSNLLSFIRKYKRTWISQERLALLAGCSRRVVNEAIDMLVSVGLLVKEYRHMKTCLYGLPFYLRYKNVIYRLREYLKGYRCFDRRLLYLNRRLALDKFRRVTQYSINDNIYIQEDSTGYIDARAQVWLKNKKKRLKRERLKHFAHLKEIAGLKLTQFGKAKLSIFCDEAIEYALDQMTHYNKDLHGKPYDYFFSHCVAWHRNSKITPHYARLEAMVRKYNINMYEPNVEQETSRDKVQHRIERQEQYQRRLSEQTARYRSQLPPISLSDAQSKKAAYFASLLVPNQKELYESRKLQRTNLQDSS